jgi:hypothetical protein
MPEGASTETQTVFREILNSKYDLVVTLFHAKK